MEPLQQALEVVSALIDEVCKELGSDAKEHINPDQLFATAQEKLSSGLAVNETIADIKASLRWDVQQKLEKKVINVKIIRENLKSAAEIMEVQDIEKKLYRDTEHLWRNGCTNGETGVIVVSSDSDTEDLPSLASKSTLDDDNTEEDDDDDVRMLTPVPRSPVQVIDITKDTTDSTNSSSSQVLTGTEAVEQSKGIKVENNVCTKSVKRRVGCGKNLAVLFNEVEVSESDDESDTQDTELETKPVNKHLAGDKSDEDEAPLSDSNDASSSDESKSLMDLQASQKPSENELSKKKNEAEKGKNINNIMPGEPNVPNWRNNVLLKDLWEDAQFVCELLPCFKLDDVYTSMYDNCYHPDRRAYILEEYINLALDRGEEVQHVFPRLQAAKKRQYPSEFCSQPMIEEKKIKIENNVLNGTNAVMDICGREGGINDSHPSTSGMYLPVSNSASYPSSSIVHNFLAPTVTDDSFNHPRFGNAQGEMAGDIGSVVNQTQEQVVGPMGDRKKWLQEKLEFITAVTSGYSEEYLKVQIELCWTDADVQALVATLLEEQDHGQAAQKSDSPVSATLLQQALSGPAATLPNHQPSTSAFQPVDLRKPSVSGLHGTPGTVGGGVVPASSAASESSAAPASSAVSDRAAAPDSSAEPQPGAEGEDQTASTVDMEDRIMKHVTKSMEMFGDADPDYLHERCVGINGDEAKFHQLVDELLENRNYPKIEDYIKRQKRLEIKKKFIEGMSVEEFLEYFEDPEKVFCETTTPVSATYVENAKLQLRRDLNFHLSKDIDAEHRKQNYHYLPTLRAVKANKNLSHRKTKRPAQMKERDLDDIFIKELCYVKMEKEINEYKQKKEEDKRKAFLMAKTEGRLKECRCCYDDEILEDDMDYCSAPNSTHKFCLNCIRRFAEEEIGQGRSSFRCLDGECKAEFSLKTLKKVMKPAIFSNILKQKQLEEIAAAGIEDLESCPFCSFQTIMPNKEDKVFKCLDPECMKDSCRFCKEPNHVPLRCEEVEKMHQKDARVNIENKMTEAMVRECWKCKKRFIKGDGCNKMKCSCGAMMCYKCRKPITGYDHFEDKQVPANPNKCPLWSNSAVIHAEEVRDAANEIKKNLDVKLLHDPLKDVPEVPKVPERKPQPLDPRIGHGNMQGMVQQYMVLQEHDRMVRQAVPPPRLGPPRPPVPPIMLHPTLQQHHHHHHFHHTQEPRHLRPFYQWEDELMQVFNAQWGQ